jgi:hypothetical protein
MSRRKTKALLDRVDRLHDNSLPPVILLYNNPEAVRLGFCLQSEREAIVAGEITRAEANESTKAFHARLVEIARARNVRLVSVGSDEPMLESRYDLDGKLKVPPEDKPMLN